MQVRILPGDLQHRAQTEMLLIMAFGHYTTEDPFLPDWKSPYFVTTGQALVQKGLASHDPNRTPTWMPTPHGIAIAEIVVQSAKRYVALMESRKEISVKEHSKNVKTENV